MKRPYLLKKRGKYWYYRLASETTFHSTGKTARSGAEIFVTNILKKNRAFRFDEKITFRCYADPFFLWDKCLHIRKLLDEGKSITRAHAKNQRRLLENYIFKDEVALKPFASITRAYLLDFRSRLRKKIPDKTTTMNKVMSVMKTIFREALYREELDRDPTYGLGIIKEQRKFPGIFTLQELQVLFPVDTLAP